MTDRTSFYYFCLLLDFGLRLEINARFIVFFLANFFLLFLKNFLGLSFP